MDILVVLWFLYFITGACVILALLIIPDQIPEGYALNNPWHLLIITNYALFLIAVISSFLML